MSEVLRIALVEGTQDNVEQKAFLRGDRISWRINEEQIHSQAKNNRVRFH